MTSLMIRQRPPNYASNHNKPQNVFMMNTTNKNITYILTILLSFSLSTTLLSQGKIHKSNMTPEAILWSEDFANGFSNSANGSWVTSGTQGNIIEYDFDGPDSLAGFGAIPSTTASNGFAIFDFHKKVTGANSIQAILTSPVIDLGVNTTSAQLKIQTMLYYCCNGVDSMTIEFSTDGGINFPNSVNLSKLVGVNNQHWEKGGVGRSFRWKISDYIAADPTNVVIRFNWTSPGNFTSGPNANYFWMIDDIEITTVPDHALEFVSGPTGEPKTDVIFDNDASNPKQGYVALNQVKPISFDANILNYGTVTQTNVLLTVDVLDANLNSIQSLVSATPVTMAENDIVTYSTFFTPTWTPTNIGKYYLVFSASTDSSSVAGFEAPTDTFKLEVTSNLMSLDWGNFDNEIGSEELGPDSSAIASLLDFPNADPDTTNYIFIDSVHVGFGPSTAAGGAIRIAIYPESAFQPGPSGFTGSPVISKRFMVTSGMPGTVVAFAMRDSLFNPSSQSYDKFGTALMSGQKYYFLVYMYANGGANPISIMNDQKVLQSNLSSLMYNQYDVRWWTGFFNSRVLNAPWIRAQLVSTPPPGIGLFEAKTEKFSIYPNPATDYLNISFSREGEYQLELINLSGELVKTFSIHAYGNDVHSINLTGLAKGVYHVSLKEDRVSQHVTLILN